MERVDTVIPGHGGPLDRDPAQRVLDEDREYLEALRRRGPDAELPRSRRSGAQRRIHAENAERLVAS